MKWLYLGAAITVALIAAMTLWQYNAEAPVIPEATQQVGTYENAEYGIGFTYPDSYVLQETNLSDFEGRADADIITLIDKAAAANIPQNGEGPTAITIAIYTHPKATSTLESWIRSVPYSNFALLANDQIEEGRIAGVDSMVYEWDGLYAGRTTAFQHRDKVILADVTYMSPSDQILKDYESVLSSLELR